MLVVAVAVGLLAPASASADTCAPGTEFTPTYEFVEGRVNVPLVATHELTVVAQFSDRVDHVALSVPDGVRVIGRRGPRMKLIVPVSASLAVTATWVQGDPGEPGKPDLHGDSDDRAAHHGHPTQPGVLPEEGEGHGRLMAFAVARDPQRGDVSPMEISIRVAAEHALSVRQREGAEDARGDEAERARPLQEARPSDSVEHRFRRGPGSGSIVASVTSKSKRREHGGAR